jgi:hypothetical protein
LVWSSAIWADDVDDVLEVRSQVERFCHHVLGHSTWRCVDLPHVQANVPCDIGEFLSSLCMDLGVEAFTSRESVVCRCDEDITAVIPHIATNNS